MIIQSTKREDISHQAKPLVHVGSRGKWKRESQKQFDDLNILFWIYPIIFFGYLDIKNHYVLNRPGLDKLLKVHNDHHYCAGHPCGLLEWLQCTSSVAALMRRPSHWKIIQRYTYCKWLVGTCLHLNMTHSDWNPYYHEYSWQPDLRKLYTVYINIYIYRPSCCNLLQPIKTYYNLIKNL